MRTYKLIALVAGAALAGLASGPTVAKSDPVYTSFFNKAGAGGYDVVAYFTTGAPTKGVAQYVVRHQGVEWRFASAANRDAFMAEPQRYAPQYGGYCAWAVSQGYTAPGDPKYWRIVDGKLYLNYDAKVQERWSKNISGFITTANKNWPSVLTK
jgi:YHS domain-containing protein